MAEIAAISNHARVSKERTGFARWWVGFQGSELLPIIPPNANLSPDSKVSPENRGKTPGKFTSGGWVGLGGSWSTKFRAEKDDAKRWERWGASVGLQTRIYHAIDIDVDDEQMAAAIEGEFKRVFGVSPVRYRDGSSRRLMLTCIADGEPRLRKRRLQFLINGKKHVVERLGIGQQCVVEGPHPKGGEYEWRDGHPCDNYRLPKHTKAKSDEFFTAVADLIELFGYEVVADKGSESNVAGKRKPIGAPELLAPSPKHVFDIFEAVRCDDKTFESRDDFVQTLSAIKAALGGSYWDEVLDWALEYPGAGDDYIANIWDSIRDAELGWSWLEAWARSHGYSTAQADFADTPTNDDDPENPGGVIPQNPIDRMLARNVYVKKQDKFYDHEEGIWMTGKAFNAANTQVAPYGRGGVQSAEAEFQNNQNARRVATTTYRPGDPVITKERNEQGIDVSAVNQWRPPSIVPAKNATAADIASWLALINTFFGEGTPEREHFLDWWAYIIQKPGRKIGHAIVLTSGQGFGKDTAMRPLFEAVGLHNVASIDTAALASQFNYYLRYQIVYVQEAKMGGRHHDLYNCLKPYISAQATRLAINEKNLQQYFIENRQNWIVTSNHDNALMLEDDDRRFWVHRAVMDEPPSDDFFADLHRWYEAGGIEKVAGWLFQRDLSSFNPMARPPVTAAKRAMLELSQPAPVRWLREQFAEGSSLAGRSVVTVKELRLMARQDWTAPQQDISDKHVTAALKAAGFKAAHRVRLKQEMVGLWARGVPGTMTADAMRDQYLTETQGEASCKAA